MAGNSLVNFGDLTKPATVLIEKVSDAVGGIARPFQIERVAKAEVNAEIIRAKAQLKIADLERRAVRRFVVEEVKKQANIEDILRKALPLLEEDSSPQNVEDDWITNFFDKGRIISDDDMQSLWSRVLAGEANSPGAFSRKTVNLLADLDKSDAELFVSLWGFGWRMRDHLYPLVYDFVDEEIYTSCGIHFGSLGHLDSLGLVHFSTLGSFLQTKLPKTVNLSYQGRPVALTFPKGEDDNVFPVGNVLLTRAGEQLAAVCQSSPVDGFFDFVYDRWAAQSLVPKRDTEGGPPGSKA